ncbi:50S ribosomal protein L29 [Longimicrobium terrae]|uniref:Large ribosomal subunit protein uL29 n=1 Tax=Longimicrobium terrae TaxID=1639882 RepID=A0A841GMW4_9BACT|nr:large subunit ribosomal protein L29 [Longimicrobium terrae]MBB6068652.1 large subunit ribosomal protein L29 [Longimicrobium terrae]NNC27838.1 50S ribosomal protein L29 [Longimicrobium terrae]
MKGTEIREMTAQEIAERIQQLQEERFRLRFRAATQQLENPTLLRTIRRDIARLKTVQRARDQKEGR